MWAGSLYVFQFGLFLTDPHNLITASRGECPLAIGSEMRPLQVNIVEGPGLLQAPPGAILTPSLSTAVSGTA